MLLPVNALDQSYIAAGWGGLGAFVVVVAIEDATTVLTNNGDYMLDAFDAWHFATAEDATGFFVGADKPVAVFWGAPCTLVPAFPWFACDHLEEQMFPLSAWGTHYPQPEEVFWRVIAAADNTTITLDPPVAGAALQLQQLGDWVEFSTAESFEATGDHPFLLVQYMSGCYGVISQTASPTQFLSADKPVGVQVGGVDWATSYGYPGGLSFNALWQPPLEPQG